MLHGLGYFRPELAVFPEEPKARRDLSLLRSDPDRFRREADEQQQALTRFLDEHGAFDAAAIAAVDAFRKAQGLDYQGNARGLVDERLVKTLRAAYYARPRSSPKP